VIGAAVKGGQMYGTFPTLALNGLDDSGTNVRWVPTTGSAISGDAGELIRGESIADGNDLPEYRELFYDESEIRVGGVSSEEALRWRAR
jgi:hypothetical protein